MKSHIITLVIGLLAGSVLTYQFGGKTETIEKPVVTVDSSYYWINASQIDTLKHLRARVDSFTVSARKHSFTISPRSIPTQGSRIDTPQIASNEPVLFNIFEADTVLSRGKDTNKVLVSFTEYPYPHFGFVSKWNDDHVLVKERVTTITLPTKKKFVTHGFAIGPGIGLLSKKADIMLTYSFTFNF